MTMLQDDSMLYLIPDACAHEWNDLCAEGLSRVRQDATRVVLVHQVCLWCRHTRVEQRVVSASPA